MVGPPEGIRKTAVMVLPGTIELIEDVAAARK
jgi:hypothetical protein